MHLNMKKICIVFFISVFLIGCAFSVYAEEFSTKTVEELHEIQAKIRTELLKRELIAQGKTLLFDDNGVSVYLTGEYEDSWMNLGDRLDVIVINDTDKTISIVPQSISVNGWNISFMSNTQVNPGKKLKGYFLLQLNGADISGFSADIGSAGRHSRILLRGL